MKFVKKKLLKLVYLLFPQALYNRDTIKNQPNTQYQSIDLHTLTQLRFSIYCTQSHN